MDRRIVGFYCMVVLGILLFLVISCTNQEEADQNTSNKKSLLQGAVEYGGIYRSPLVHNPSTLDPLFIEDIYGASVAYQLFDRLVQFDPYLNILPGLAESWQVEDQGKLYRFFLRPDVFFHDGNPVTIEDIIFSIKRVIRMEPPTAVLPHFLKICGAQAFRDLKSDQLEGLQALNDHVLLVRLTETHMPFLSAIGSYQAAIVPRQAVLENPSSFSRHPIGTGPFKLVSWEPNQSLRLERFSDYYGGAAYLDGIEYHIYPGEPIDEILSDFRNKKIEEMTVRGDIRHKLDSMKTKRFDRPLLNLFFLGMNCRHPNLRNVEFRKALFQALDRKKMIHDVHNGQYEVASTILPPGLPGYKPVDHSHVEYNRLSQPLESSEEKEISIEIVSSLISAHAQAELEFVRRAWQKIGVALKIKYITNWTEFEEYLKSDAVQVYRYDWTADMPDTDSFLYPLFASDSPLNYCHYSNGEVDAMLLKARAIIDPVERAAIYHQIGQQIMQDMPIIPLFHLKVERVYQPYVQGVHISALGIPYTSLHHFWLSKPGIDSMPK